MISSMNNAVIHWTLLVYSLFLRKFIIFHFLFVLENFLEFGVQRGLQMMGFGAHSRFEFQSSDGVT